MIRFAVRVAVVLFLAHSAYRIGSEYRAHLRFQDAVRQAASSGVQTNDELGQRVATLATQHGVPLTRNDLKVRQSERNVFVSGSYTRPIGLVPLYSYPWRFELLVEAEKGLSLVPNSSRPSTKAQR
jgi:hypothetical protein